MDLSPDVLEELRAQLRAVAEQVRSLETMVADGRDCRAIVGRLATARKDLEQTGFRIIGAEANGCLTGATPSEKAERLQDLQQLLQRLS